jgi:hypothetical protein
LKKPSRKRKSDSHASLRELEEEDHGMNPGRQTVHVITVIASVLSLAGCTSNTHAGETLGGLGCGNHCPSSPEFLYATSPDHVLAFTIDQSTGAPSSSLTTAGPNQSSGMTSTVTLGHLYVSDFQNDTVDGFSVNSSNGALAPIPFFCGRNATGSRRLVFNHLRQHLHVCDRSQRRNGYRLCLRLQQRKADGCAGLTIARGQHSCASGASRLSGQIPIRKQSERASRRDFSFHHRLQHGTLTPIPGSPFPTGTAGSFPGPSALVVNGNFLYIALAGTANANNQIVVFAIDQNTGSLTPIPGSPFATGKDPL